MSNPSQRAFRILNAPITIWLLSITAVGLFGAVYQDMRRCRVEADRAVFNFHRLGTEIANRRQRLYQAIADASSINDLRADEVVAGRESWYTYLDFQGRTIKDLEGEYVQVGKRLAHFPTEILDMVHERFQRGLEVWNDRDVGPIRRIDLDRPDLSKLTDADLPILKKLAVREDRIVLNATLKVALLKVVPACGPWMSFQRVVSGQPDIVGVLRAR